MNSFFKLRLFSYRLFRFLVFCSLFFISDTISGQDVSIVGDVTPSSATTPVWDIGNEALFVGFFDAASLNIVGLGSVFSGYSYIGHSPGSEGIVNVSGEGFWSNSSNLIVGGSGDGTLRISDSGMVSNSLGIIGNVSGSNGEVFVDGGNWVNSGKLYVGYRGSGLLDISAGEVSNTDGYIGRGVGLGRARVSGGSWINSENLYVGFMGSNLIEESAVLEITGTGTVSSNYGYIGHSAFSNSAVRVSAGSWTNAGAFFVGYYGSGLLEISETGLVSSGSSTRIGNFGGSEGTVRVSGGRLESGSDLYIGYRGIGLLEISGNGIVTNSKDAYIGSEVGSNGNVRVSGEGSFISSRNITVGHYGRGMLEISDEGSVSGAGGRIGSFEGAEGIVRVSGGNWINTSSLVIGARGSGLLEISGTGVVSNKNFGLVGSEADSNGIVHVSDGGIWANSRELYLGFFGDGHLDISGSALVSSTSTELAYFAGATGRLELNGGTLRTNQLRERQGDGIVIFDGGTLELSSNQSDLFSGFETGDVSLLNNGGIIDTREFNASTSLALSGIGALTKTGTGSLTLTGINSYVGGTNVNEGRLYVDGSLADGNVIVTTGATLAGSGSIGGDVTVESGGVLSPGRSPGILNVGSLNLNSGATTIMELNGLIPGSEHDQIVVANHANLDGALQLSYGYSPQNGDAFTLIDADSITGDFASITNPLGNALVFDVRVSDDYVFEIVAVQTDFVDFVGIDSDLVNIANVIDANFSDATLIPMINELNMLPGEALPIAFDLINPDELAALSRVMYGSSRNAAFRIGNRLNEVRGGVGGFSSAGFNLYDENGQHIPNSLIAATAIPAGLQPATVSDTYESVWSYFISGNATMSDYDGDANGAGFKDDQFGLLWGADYSAASDLSIGLHLGYDHGEVDISANAGEIEVNTYRLGVHGTWWTPVLESNSAAKQSIYAEAYLGTAYHEFDIVRGSFGGDAEGDTDATGLDGGFAVGYESGLGKWSFTTELGIDYIYLWLDGYQEKGGFAPLEIGDDTSEVLYSTLSFRVEYKEMLLRPYVELGWRHQYLDDSESVTARFAGSGAGSFTVNGSKLSRDSLVSGLGMKAYPKEGVTAELGYYGEYNSDFVAHGLNATLRVAW